MPERAMFCFSCSTVVRRAVVGVRHHRAAAEALLGDLGPAHARRPQRLHPGAVDARRQHELVVDLLQRLEVRGIEDVAVGVLDDDAQRVAQSAQVLLVREVVLDVRLALRNHLLEARVQHEPRRRRSSRARTVSDAADDDHRQSVVENQAFEPVARVPVEIRDVADDRHRLERGGCGCHHLDSPLCAPDQRAADSTTSRSARADDHRACRRRCPRRP